MTAAGLLAALGPVTDAFDTLGVPYYLTGSIASSAHGVARASLDADLVADLSAAHAEPLIRALTADYYIPVERLRAALRERSSFNLIHFATMFKIDVFVSKGRPFDREAATRTRMGSIEDAAGAASFPIASPEDTVLAKLEWFQRGGETSERQWWDIVGILRVTPDLDRAYLERWGAALGVSELLTRAQRDAGDTTS